MMSILAALRRHLHRPLGLLVAMATLGLGLAAAPAAHAEDIDIYGGNSTSTASNVLFFIDNTSNWSTAKQAWNALDAYNNCKNTSADCQTDIDNIFYYGQPASTSGGPHRPWDSGFNANSKTDNVSLYQGQVEVRALRYVLDKLVCSTTTPLTVNVGLMLWNTSGSARSNSDVSGYIAQNVQPLTTTVTTGTPSCTTLKNLLTTIDSQITSPTYKGPSSADYGSAMFEVFKYFGGYTNPNLAAYGTAGAPTGRLGYGPLRFSNANALEDPTAFTDSGKTQYAGPSASGGACGQDYLVLIGNAYPNFEPSGSPARFSGLNYTFTQLPADPTRYADEWSQFLANTDVNGNLSGMQKVLTYTMDVYFAKQDTSQTALLQSMAQYGGVGQDSGYIPVAGDLTSIVDGLGKILVSVAAVDSVFTATTLPVSTTTQGSYLNQLFIGMFRPDASGGPRWVGNLKQYKLGFSSTGDLMVQTADGQPAILSSTGYFSPLATSYWTSTSVFFNNNPMGTPLSNSDSPDGQVVEKGGVAQQIRNANLTGATGRKVYTLPASPIDGTALASDPFTSTNTAALAAGLTADEINWIRGENNITPGASGSEYYGATQSGSTITSLASGSARPSIHGDILHSRPVALNYGNGQVVVFYGSNDGLLHAIDGRQDTSVGGGSELWSFIAPEHYGMFIRQHDDTPVLWLPSTTSTGGAASKPDSTAEKKDYAMDGPIGVFATYNSSGVISEAIIYATMRRGGNTVYAFDVSSPTNPILKWKISGGSGDYSRLGQTWSTPRAVVFPSSTGIKDPYVLMGGGYDPGEDSQPATSTGVGNVVYVINGRTGALLAALPTDYSVPGDVTVVDSNSDGIYDRGYVSDVRGNLYRIDFTTGGVLMTDPSKWTIKKIAALGGKVFFAPDVIPTRDFVAVLTGTGDREKPLMTSTSDNFFLVKDTVLGATDRTTVLTKSDLSMVASVDNATDQIVNANPNVNNANGCYLQLATDGEKVVNAPYSVAGATYFGTNRPSNSKDEESSASTCSVGNLGIAHAYQFPLFCGVPTSTPLQGGGLPPSPVGGLVTITNADGSTSLVNFIIGAGRNDSAFEAMRPRPPIPTTRKRTYWHVEGQNR